LEGKKTEPSRAKTAKGDDNSESAIRVRLVPITVRKKDGTLVRVLKDPVTGKRYAP